MIEFEAICSKKNFRRCVSLNFRLYAVKKIFRRCVSLNIRLYAVKKNLGGVYHCINKK